jgi:hypothetical protein
MRFGYSIFCDDIRNEIGGKLSFIGCYNGIIFVPPEFPLVIPRFCVHLQIFSPAQTPYSSIIARCYAPSVEAPIFEAPVETPEQSEQQALLASVGREPAAPLYIVAATSLIFAPLHILGPGLLRVRAKINGEDEELRLGSLRIEARRNADARALAS